MKILISAFREGVQRLAVPTYPAGALSPFIPRGMLHAPHWVGIDVTRSCRHERLKFEQPAGKKRYRVGFKDDVSDICATEDLRSGRKELDQREQASPDRTASYN